MTKNKYVLNWIDEMAAMTQPDKIVWKPRLFRMLCKKCKALTAG